ncbi:MAG: HDOD domain-containing protein [Deltaproteobacteria bacterium]|nr:HDOD domain-containing protein [Deltaproteobacteria bacterium]
MTVSLDEIVNRIKEIPPMPLVAIKVVEAMGSKNVSARKLSEIIAMDQAVSARVLRMANSSFYAPKKKISTLDMAVVLLGEETLKSLVLAFSLKGVSRKFGLTEKMQWEDSMGCAIGSRLTAKWFRSADSEEAFLAGLFRHIGKVVMNNLDPVAYQRVVEGVYNGEGTAMELEKAYFPYSHAEIGAAVLRKWNFTENLVEAVRRHEECHLEEIPDLELRRLTATVAVADAMCQRAGIGRRAPDETLELAATPAAQILAIDEEQAEQLLGEFLSIFERDKETFFS